MKKIGFIILVLIVGLMFFGCTVKLNNNTYQAGIDGTVVSQWPPKEVEECIAYDELAESGSHSRAECFAEVAILKNDEKICQNSNLIAQWDCIILFAKEKNDSTACESISEDITEISISFNGSYTYKAKDLCYFYASSDKNSFCSKISDLNAMAYCANLYDKSVCYNISDLSLRVQCFGISEQPLFGGQKNFDISKCPEKIIAFDANGQISKPNYNDESIPYVQQVAVNTCIMQKAIDTENPGLCGTLEKSSKDVADFCYFMVAKYFQIDLCDNLRPSCTYDGTLIDWDGYMENPISFGKEYCKIQVNKYRKDSLIINSYWLHDMHDMSFCPVGTNYGWSKYVGDQTLPIDCTKFCNAKDECSIIGSIKGCFRTNTYNGEPTDNAGVGCLLGNDAITDKDVDSLYCCCPNGS